MTINNTYIPVAVETDMFQKVFKSAQICWWYVLYAPEYSTGWDKDTLMEYADRARAVSDAMDEAEAKRRAENPDDNNESNMVRRMFMNQIKDETGFDIKAKAQDFPYSLGVKMYGKKPEFRYTKIAVFQFKQAVEEALLIATYTLLNLYKVEPKDIEKKYEEFLEFTSLYARGLGDQHILKYFNDIEDIPVID